VRERDRGGKSRCKGFSCWSDYMGIPYLDCDSGVFFSRFSLFSLSLSFALSFVMTLECLSFNSTCWIFKLKQNSDRLVSSFLKQGMNDKKKKKFSAPVQQPFLIV
jgi:hypothetical protein